MRGSWVRLVGVAVATAALLGASAPDGPAAPLSAETQNAMLAELAGVRPSSELTGPVIATGTIEGAGAGVPVVADAWPDQETLGRVEIGGFVDVVTIAAALTDADGSFELVADPEALAGRVGATAEIVNIDVTAFDAGCGLAMMATSVKLSVSSGEVEVGDELDEPHLLVHAVRPLTIGEVVAAPGSADLPPSCGE
ncbi:hypothetical protein [Cellulomonas sp.]|uniref:hypothetical protein n=1 Tax=Cellulomonas sp. TaxID=40001 RepID=UPI00258E5679|nr:hypothetical protein [Cellulomonas sp.]MCR6688308.1 hypothetical protein [Cellulomonas sp.]